MPRPDRLVVVLGTGTDVGKTWVTAAVIAELRRWGRRVAVRKPVQSFQPEPEPAPATAAPAAATATDADLLAAATGEAPSEVCPAHRWYERPMAPPMAAEALGRPGFTIADLLDELAWPAGVDVGLVEGAGGVCSPLADDGDAVALVAALGADHVVIVADAALGSLSLVKLSTGAFEGSTPIVVHLNRFDGTDDLQRRNRAWMEGRMGLTTTTTPAGLAAVLDAAEGSDVTP